MFSNKDVHPLNGKIIFMPPTLKYLMVGVCMGASPFSVPTITFKPLSRSLEISYMDSS